MKIIDIQPRTAILIILFLFLISYSIFQARALLSGPRIQIENPKNGQVVENPLIVVEGQSKNISWISLNDHQIFTDEDGRWSEKLLVSTGLSIITIKARDRFGHETTTNIQIVLNN